MFCAAAAPRQWRSPRRGARRAGEYTPLQLSIKLVICNTSVQIQLSCASSMIVTHVFIYLFIVLHTVVSHNVFVYHVCTCHIHNMWTYTTDVRFTFEWCAEFQIKRSVIMSLFMQYKEKSIIIILKHMSIQRNK